MFMERVAPVVDATISALARKKFDVDPIAGAHYSRATSGISTAYKRHGKPSKPLSGRIAREQSSSSLEGRRLPRQSIRAGHSTGYDPAYPGGLPQASRVYTPPYFPGEGGKSDLVEGKYAVTLKATGENCATVSRTVRFYWDGKSEMKFLDV